MNRLLRIIMKIVGLMGGRERDEWTAAMTAELISLEGPKTSWALGCLAAAFHDSLTREWPFLLAMILTPTAASFIGALLIPALVPIFRIWHPPGYAWIILYMGTPLLFTGILAAYWPSRAVLIGVSEGVLAIFVPMLIMMLWFGVPLSTWANGHSQIYNVRPLAGIGMGILLWTLAALIGGKIGSFRNTLRTRNR